MWVTSIDSDHPRASVGDADIDVLVDPRTSDADAVGILRVTIAAGARMTAHDHGESEAVLLPLTGELLIVGAGGRVERLHPGILGVVPAHEQVSIQNPTPQPASMIVCFAPATFLERLDIDRDAGIEVVGASA